MALMVAISPSTNQSTDDLAPGGAKDRLAGKKPNLDLTGKNRLRRREEKDVIQNQVQDGYADCSNQESPRNIPRRIADLFRDVSRGVPTRVCIHDVDKTHCEWTGKDGSESSPVQDSNPVAAGY